MYLMFKWGAAVAQRLSDGMRKYTKSKDPEFAPQPSPGNLLKNLMFKYVIC
jgi:hypothetical protein